MSKREQFVEIAKSQVGIRETGTNNVKYNTWYYGHEVNGTAGTSEYAWCVVFECWCANQVGILNTLIPKCNNVGVLRDWYKAKGLYHTYGYNPKKGDLVIFKNACHTGIVAKFENGRVYTIEGNSGDKVASHNYDLKDSYIAGFCQVQFDDKTSSGNYSSVKDIQKTLKSRYGYNLSIDNIYGDQTHKYLVEALQTELNKQYNAGLKVDGIFGNKTKSKCISLRLGARGNITYLVQGMLVCRGYKLIADGYYGEQSLNIIKDFQRAKKLYIDGICGRETFAKLFG